MVQTASFDCSAPSSMDGTSSREAAATTGFLSYRRTDSISGLALRVATAFRQCFPAAPSAQMLGYSNLAELLQAYRHTVMYSTGVNHPISHGGDPCTLQKSLSVCNGARPNHPHSYFLYTPLHLSFYSLCSVPKHVTGTDTHTNHTWNNAVAIQALQNQLYGGQASAWNFGVAYRIPDTNINLSGTYQQGKANLQVRFRCRVISRLR